MDYSNDKEALQALLSGHRDTLNRVLQLAEPVPGRDRVAQRILNSLAGDARAYLRRVEATLKRPVFHPTHGDLGLWGRNGLAPTIADLAHRAEFHATYVEPVVIDRGNGRFQVAA